MTLPVTSAAAIIKQQNLKGIKSSKFRCLQFQFFLYLLLFFYYLNLNN